MFKKKSFFEAMREDSPYKVFFLSVITMGLAYGIYKGILDNYFAEIVKIGEFDRGVMEFFRELPGLLLVFFLAVFYMLSAEQLYKIGAVIALIGICMIAAVPAEKVLVVLAVCVYSFGEHIQLGMRSSLTLEYAKEGKGGEALGCQSSMQKIGQLAGFAVVFFAFLFLSGERAFRIFFWVSAALTTVSVIYTLRLKGRSKQDSTKSRFYFRKKFYKYYMLEVFYGARKQVFFTFGPYVLILLYGADTKIISLLFAISAIAEFLMSPVVGRIIDRVGYKPVMVADTLLLVIVCFFYGFAHHIFPKNVAFIVCCANYVLDSIISLASLASNVYVQDISDSMDEMRATISTGVSVNHMITILIALFGGWIWQTIGVETLFILSAALGLCNSAYAATIKVKHPEGEQQL